MGGRWYESWWRAASPVDRTRTCDGQGFQAVSMPQCRNQARACDSRCSLRQHAGSGENSLSGSHSGQATSGSGDCSGVWDVGGVEGVGWVVWRRRGLQKVGKELGAVLQATRISHRPENLEKQSHQRKQLILTTREAIAASHRYTTPSPVRTETTTPLSPHNRTHGRVSELERAEYIRP